MAAVLAQRSRRTQAQRSDATRAKLLDAAVSLLAEVGYAQLTTAAVAERAGVSRGAELHHFPTRTDLVAATVRHVARLRCALLSPAAAATDRGAALSTLVGAYQGQVFVASLELWVAARTDSVLRATLLPVERDLDAMLLELCRGLLGGEALPAGWQVDEVTLDLLRGAGMSMLLSPADATDRWQRLLEGWQRILAAAEVGRRATGRTTAPLRGGVKDGAVRVGATGVGRLADR